MKTVAQLLKHDFDKGSLYLYDSNGNQIYHETDGYWYKQEFDSKGNRIYYETSNVYWCKIEYDSNGNRIYSEDSNGTIIDNRPKDHLVKVRLWRLMERSIN